jgi:hypothetical protein
MNAYSSSSVSSGHIGWTRGPPSTRVVARKARPTPYWYSSALPASARSGRRDANSAHLTAVRVSNQTAHVNAALPSAALRRTLYL